MRSVLNLAPCFVVATLATALTASSTGCDGAAPKEPKSNESVVGEAPQSAPPKAEGATPAASPKLPPPIAADAKAAVGQAAPDFTLVDATGKEYRLSDYAGKAVVLEWFNPECPFVNHAHTDGSLKSMAATQTENGVVWLAINSGGPGKQGHGAQKNLDGAKKFGMEHPILLDETGAVGRAYGAKKTPHVYLIGASGTLVYRGAIDNAPFGEVDGGGALVNYLEGALKALSSGDTISTPQRPAYGCTVKYGA